jgi:hypothetical protein
VILTIAITSLKLPFLLIQFFEKRFYHFTTISNHA